MSEITPWEQHEIDEALGALKKMADRARVIELTARWLVTMRTADGAERHFSSRGLPSRHEIRVPLPRPVKWILGMAPGIIDPIDFPTRVYELRDYSMADRTAVYVERVP